MGVEQRGERRVSGPVAALFTLASLLFAAKVAQAQATPSTASPAANAAPDAPTVALSWSGPEAKFDCLGGERLASAVDEYLGREAFSASPADLTLRVQVERRPDRAWRALLRIVDFTGAVVGERELVSESTLCSSLDEPLKLAVALMVDSELVASAEPEPEPPPEPPEPIEPEPVEPEPPSTPWVVSGDASVLIQSGLLPSVSPGLELGLELRPSSWVLLRANGAGFLPGQVSLGGPAQAKISIAYGQLTICPQTALGARFRLSGCAGVAAGTLFAKTSQLQEARSTQRRFLAASLGARASAQLSERWSIVAQVGGVLPYRPERFVYELNGQRREFFRMSSPSLVAGIGCSVMF